MSGRATNERAGRRLERAAAWSLVGCGLTFAGGTLVGQSEPVDAVSGAATDPFVVGCVVLTLVGVVGFARTGAGGGPSTLLALGPVSGLALSQVGWGVDPRLAVVVTAATVGTAALLGGVGVVTARVADASHPERAR
jgi:FtsH-binding integral membrane protein